MKTLREKLIRLAAEQPQLRKDLLPLLRTAQLEDMEESRRASLKKQAGSLLSEYTGGINLVKKQRAKTPRKPGRRTHDEERAYQELTRKFEGHFKEAKSELNICYDYISSGNTYKLADLAELEKAIVNFVRAAGMVIATNFRDSE